MTPEIRIADRCLREGCFVAEAQAADAEDRLRRAADPLTPPDEPRWSGWRSMDAEPRRFPVIGWIVLAWLVLGVAAVVVWASR